MAFRDMKMRTKTAIILSKFFFRFDRGQAHIGKFSAIIHDFIMAGIMIDLVYRYLNFLIPFWVAIILIIFGYICYYLLGWLDEKKGFWKIANEYGSSELNPFFKEINRKIDSINKKIHE